jgi:hypothetical protein
MPTESFPIAPTVLSVPLHSYGMLAYHPEISDLRSRSEIAAVGTTAIFFFGSLASDFKFEI